MKTKRATRERLERPVSHCFVSATVAMLFGSFAWLADGEEPDPLAPASDPAIRVYEEQVRPILVRRCYECHSADADELQGNLALDRRGGWQRGGDRGPALMPSKPDESLLIQAIRYDDPDLQMPPDSKLPQEEIDVLTQWIAAGAPAPDDETEPKQSASDAFDLEARRAAHWAWQPIRNLAPPDVQQNNDWSRDAVDRFVLQRLEREGIAPAEEVDRAVWLRRATFDLTGLPPTRQELAEFLRDQAPDAYEKVVDRLLAGPAFGECWGQHWLDLVRYAETKGHENDYEIPHAWRYRDYVIEAFNANVPFDELVREHVAGDLIWPPRVDERTHTNQSIQGTAFWHLGEATHSPVDIRGDEADRIDNQIDVFGKAFLGLTIACARCHDHKFDAISTADYYALCGFLQSSSYQTANVADPLQLAKLEAELRELHESTAGQLFALFAQRMRERLEHLPAALVAAVENTSDQTEPHSLRAEIERARQEPKHPLHALATQVAHRGEDASIEAHVTLAGWKSATKRTVVPTAGAVVDFQHGDAVWITSGWAFGRAPVAVGDVVLRPDERQPIAEVVAAPAARAGRLSHKFTGLYRTPTFTIPSGKLWYRYRGKAEVFAAIDSHRTVFGPLHGVVKQQLDSPEGAVWSCHELVDYIGHRAHIEFTPQGDFELFEVRFAEDDPAKPQAANEFMAQVLDELSPQDLPSLAAAVVEAFRRALAAVESGTANRGAAELVNWLIDNESLLPAGSASTDAPFQSLAANFARRHRELEAQIHEPVWAIAMLDGNGVDECIHLRGSHRRLAPKPTPRRFLVALNGEIDLSAPGSGRLQLAEKLLAPDNPLTARVFVNRVWNHLFGRGIVPTVDNFGVLGEPPTHLELLDFLAAEFIADDRNVKNLIRRLVLSSTYRMASQPTEEALARDPANRLFHSARVRRLPAEAVRDALLAVAGNIDRQRGGPSVPAHISDFMRDNRSPEQSGPLDGNLRRSIYLQVRRNAMSHFLAAFDKPAPTTTIGARQVSNSPAQPLVLLNDPLVQQQAEIWASSLVDRWPSDAERIVDAYLTAFAREPDLQEVTKIGRFLDQSVSGQSSRDELINAWKQVCLTLISMKEFIYLR